jgi:CheY-like chemotaxis protein
MAHVLVANADADMREVLVEILTEAGHKVFAVSDGEVAWRLLHALPSTMVAVLDIVMPPLGRLGVLQKILTDPQVVRRHGLIVLTALPLCRLRSFAPDLLSNLPESVVVLMKPFDLEDLEQAVESVAQTCLAEKCLVEVVR